MEEKVFEIGGEGPPLLVKGVSTKRFGKESVRQSRQYF